MVPNVEARTRVIVSTPTDTHLARFVELVLTRAGYEVAIAEAWPTPEVLDAAAVLVLEAYGVDQCHQAEAIYADVPHITMTSNGSVSGPNIIHMPVNSKALRSRVDALVAGRAG